MRSSFSLTAAAALFLLGGFGSCGEAGAERRSPILLSWDQAEWLTSVYLDGALHPRTKYGFEENFGLPKTELLSITAFVDIPNSEGTAGIVIVDLRNGIMWDAVSCDEIKTRVVVEARAILRKNLGITDQILRTQKPENPCESDP